MWSDTRKGSHAGELWVYRVNDGFYRGSIRLESVCGGPHIKEVKSRTALIALHRQQVTDFTADLIWESGLLLGTSASVQCLQEAADLWVGKIEGAFICSATTQEACQRMVAIEYVHGKGLAIYVDRLSEPFVNDSRQASADRATQDEGVSRVD